MSFTAISNVLITSRTFPKEILELTSELTKMYTEISQSVNFKSNGLYETTQVNTSNSWFSTGNVQSRRQSFRTVYTFDAIAAGATLTIDHGISGIVQVVALYGNAITAGNVNANRIYVPIPYASVSNVNMQIELYVSGSQIFILNGAGGDNILSGTIVIEYLLN